MGWFGILSGTAMSFLSVYAARLGGSGFQIGLLAGTSAFVNLILAIPASQLFQKRPVGRTVFWSSVLYRIGYLLWIPLPWLFGNQGQIWALIAITLLMGIPLTVQAIGFNALFAAAVPLEWRASVAGTRNLLYSVTYMLSALGAGWLLVHLAFPVGYQVVFGIGGFAALMSCVHLFFVRVPPSVPITPDPPTSPVQHEHEKPAVRSRWLSNLRLDIWRTPYAGVLLAMLGLHFTQYLAIPLFPLFSGQCVAPDRSKHRHWHRPLLFDQYVWIDSVEPGCPPFGPPQSHRSWLHDHELLSRSDGLLRILPMGIILFRSSADFRGR